MNVEVDLPVFPDPYQTPAGVESPSRKPFWPAGYFFPRMIGEVFRASRLARRKAYGEKGWIRSSWHMLQFLEGAGCRFDVAGMQSIRSLKGEPLVFVANHMSTAETFLLNLFLYPFGPVTFVVKRSLVEMPVFKHVLIDREAIVVSRKNPRDDYRVLLQDGTAALKAGTSVIVFPQTTRGERWSRESFNTVGVKLARSAGVRVVPVALATDGWQNGKWIKDLGAIRPEKQFRFRFGQPIEVRGNGKDAHNTVLAFIEEALREWGYPVDASDGVGG